MTSPLEQLNLLKRDQFALGLLIFSLVTIMAWIGVSMYFTQRQPTLSPEIQFIAQPLNPNLDQDTVKKIEDETYYDPNTLTSFPIYVLYKDKTNSTTRMVTLEEAKQLQTQDTQKK